jgi:hypothetical protein
MQEAMQTAVSEQQAPLQTLPRSASSSSLTVITGNYVIDERYEPDTSLFVGDDNVFIMIAHLVRNVASSQIVFDELFVHGQQHWKLLLRSMLTLGQTADIQDAKLFVRFANVMTAAFGRMFETAS